MAILIPNNKQKHLHLFFSQVESKIVNRLHNFDIGHGNFLMGYMNRNSLLIEQEILFNKDA